MIILNFSHPLNETQKNEIEALTGERITRVIDLPVHFENQNPFLPQLEELVEKIPLDAEAMQSAQILVNPPALNFITAILLAELHGSMGYFPPIIRTRPVKDSLPPRYEIAEILNLQAIRDAARRRRTL